MPSKIVVLGATGQQGGAVAAALKAGGGDVTIVTPTRNPESTAAKALAAAGCQLATLTSLEAEAELTALFQGAAGVFAVTTFVKAGNKFDCEMEKRQGEAIVKAAKAAGVPFLVFTSVGSAADKTGVPHFDSKMHIEELIDQSG